MSEIPAPAADKPLCLEVPQSWRDVIDETVRLRVKGDRFGHMGELLYTLAARRARGTLGAYRHDIVRCAAILLHEIDRIDDAAAVVVEPADPRED